MKTVLVAVILLIYCVSFAANRSPSRKLLSDLDSLPFGHDPKKVGELFKKQDKTHYKLIKVVEGRFEKEIKKRIDFPYLIKKNQNFYDEDFSIVTRSNHSQLSLRQINDFTLSRFYPIHKWNPLIRFVRLTFFKDRLYEKEASLHFQRVSQALVVLRVLKGRLGEAQSEESEIQYRGYNRFLWKNKKIRVEYIFHPAKNKYSQVIGYTGTLTISDLKGAREARSHIRKVKSKIRRLLSNGKN